jgi:hypothetical protein
VRWHLSVEPIRAALNESIRQLSNLTRNEENLIDKRILTQLLVRYFSEPTRKTEVLELMARILNFGDEEKKKVGLISAGRWGFVPFFGRSSTSATATDAQDNDAQQKVWSMCDTMTSTADARNSRLLTSVRECNRNSPICGSSSCWPRYPKPSNQLPRRPERPVHQANKRCNRQHLSNHQHNKQILHNRPASERQPIESLIQQIRNYHHYL